MTGSTPRRLSPLTPLVRGPILVVAFLAASWQQLLSGGDLSGTSLLLLVLLLGGGVWGVASWVRTTYWVGDDELRIDTGVVSRQSRRIRVDRLQGIDILQPFVARLFGLAELRFDLAGGDREGTLAFLPLAEAKELRAQLLLRRDARLGFGPHAPAHGPGTPGLSTPGLSNPGVGNPGVGAPGPDPAEPPTPEPGATPLGVPAGDAAALSRAPAPTLAGPPDELQRAVGGRGLGPTPPPDEQQERLAKLDLGLLLASLALSGETIALSLATAGVLVTAALAGTPLLAAGGVLPVAAGFVLSLGRRLTGYYDFTVSRSPGALHVRRGMTSLARQTIALHRVQGVVVHEPLLWRPFGWARVEVSLAGYQGGGSDQAAASSVLMPVAPRAQALWLAREALRGLEGDRVPLVGVPARARLFAPFFWKTYGLGMDERVVVARRGWFTRRLDVVPQARVQSVRVEQGPLQRRLGLVDLSVDVPPGPVRLRGRQRDAGQAYAERLRLVELSRTARRAR